MSDVEWHQGVDPEHQLPYGFALLFQGNDGAFGTEDGGCDRGDPDLTTAGRWNDYMDRIENHLEGRRSMGVYPMIHRLWPEGDWAVRWGCIDFDEGEEESWVHAVNVRAALAEFGITAWIERSRSKGFHNWVFSEVWLPAKTMRAALLAACQLVGAPTKEINPKSVELSAGQLGNYVRAPYPGALSNAVFDGLPRRVMLSPELHGAPYSVQQFVEQALATRTNEAQLEQVAALLKQKPKSLNKHSGYVVDTETEPISRLSGLAYTLLMEGPREGRDRSSTLYNLARLMAEGEKHTYDEALDILVQADLSWGKYFERPDGGEHDLRRLLDKAWQE